MSKIKDNKVDVTMLKMLSTDEAIGYYSYAQKTVNIVLTMCSAVTATFLPRLSYYYENDKNGFYKLFDKGFQILCVGVIPLAIGLFIVAQQAVILLYGNDFAPTGETIRLMCPLILIKGFGDLLCYQLAYSSKNERILLPASTFASVINIIANAILIPIYSQNGAVIASVLSELTTNVIQFVYLYRKVKYHIEIKSIVIAFVSSLVMAICVYSLINPKLSLAVALIVEIGLGGVSYLIMNLLMKNQVMVELLSKVLKKSRTKI